MANLAQTLKPRRAETRKVFSHPAAWYGGAVDTPAHGGETKKLETPSADKISRLE